MWSSTPSSSQPDDHLQNGKREVEPRPFPSARSQSPYPPSSQPLTYDPFSASYLFLSRKIKQEVATRSGVQQWSRQIETDLVNKILPEFKKQFPNHQLLSSLVKKIWQKIHFYYNAKHLGGSLQSQTVDLYSLIRHQLSATHERDQANPSNAYQIATEVSEWLATLEGKCLDIVQLTRLVSTVQRHLGRDRSSHQAPDPEVRYDNRDRLIIKQILEITAHDPQIGSEQLKQAITDRCALYRKIGSLIKKSLLTSTLSQFLAHKFYHAWIDTKLSDELKEEMTTFICAHINFAREHAHRGEAPHHLELTQRIIALYLLGGRLPPTLDPKLLREEIDYVRAVILHKQPSLRPPTCPDLLLFVHAQLRLFSSRQLHQMPIALIEDQIRSCYHQLKRLWKMPLLNELECEILIWKLIGDGEQHAEQIDPELAELTQWELGQTVLDHPYKNFHQLIGVTLQFLKQAQQATQEGHEVPGASQPRCEQLFDHKIEFWVLQRDVLYRSIHIDRTSPIITIINDCSPQFFMQQATLPSHVIGQTLTQLFARLPHLRSFDQELRNRLQVLLTYLHFTDHAQGGSSAYASFLSWHCYLMQGELTQLTQREQAAKLRSLSLQLLPCFPPAQEALETALLPYHQNQPQNDKRNA